MNVQTAAFVSASLGVVAFLVTSFGTIGARSECDDVPQALAAPLEKLRHLEAPPDGAKEDFRAVEASHAQQEIATAISRLKDSSGSIKWRLDDLGKAVDDVVDALNRKDPKRLASATADADAAFDKLREACAR